MNKSKFNAIEHLYKDYYDDCVCRVYRMIGNYHDAEDVISELFLDIIKYESAKRVNYKHLVELCELMVQTHYKKKFLTDKNSYSAILRDPLDIILENERRQTLEKNILGFNKKYGKVMSMNFFDGIKPYEIGRILGVKGNTIAHKITRGKGLLKQYLIKKGYR